MSELQYEKKKNELNLKESINLVDCTGKGLLLNLPLLEIC